MNTNRSALLLLCAVSFLLILRSYLSVTHHSRSGESTASESEMTTTTILAVTRKVERDAMRLGRIERETAKSSRVNPTRYLPPRKRSSSWPITPCPASATQLYLLYAHARKTGGSSVKRTFSSYWNAVGLPFDVITPFSSDSRFRAYRVMSGDAHSVTSSVAAAVGRRFRCERAPEDVFEWRCNHREDGNKCIRWIYFLRDPNKRVLSAYQACVGRRGKLQARCHFHCAKNSTVGRLMSEGLSFLAYARMPYEERQKCVRYSRDEQFYSLVGRRGGGVTMDDENNEEKNDAQDKGNTAELLELAIARLRSAAFVGLTDHFALSMATLNRHLLRSEMDKYQPYSNANFEGKRTKEEEENLTEDDRAVIKRALGELNALDSKIYAVAQELFWRRARETWGPNVRSMDEASFAKCDSNVVCFDKRLINTKTRDLLTRRTYSGKADEDEEEEAEERGKATNPFAEEYLETHSSIVPYWSEKEKRYTNLGLEFEEEKEDSDAPPPLDLGLRKKFTACAPKGGCKLLLR